MHTCHDLAIYSFNIYNTSPIIYIWHKNHRSSLNDKDQCCWKLLLPAMVIKTDMTGILNYARNEGIKMQQQVQHNRPTDNRMSAVEKTSLVYRKVWQWLAYTEHPLYAENVNVNSISTHHRTIMIYIITFICLCNVYTSMDHVPCTSRLRRQIRLENVL